MARELIMDCIGKKITFGSGMNRRHEPFGRSIGLALLFALTASARAAEPAAAGEPLDWRAALAPFHTVFLHMPIGFVAVAALLEVYSWFKPSPQLQKAIGLILWGSAVSAIIVSALGWFRGADGGYEVQALERHRWYGVGVSVVTTLMAMIHWLAYRKDKSRRFFAMAYRCALAVDMVLLTMAGHLGGNLTHGSKYLFVDAPPWVGEWAKKVDDHVIKLETKVVESDVLAPVTGAVKPKPSPAEAATPAHGGSGVYAEVLQPAFEKKCYQCHGPEKQKGGYRMDTVEGLFKTGESELEPIVKGKPLDSYLVEVITLPKEDEFVMPPEGKEALTAEETLALIQWIWDGAQIGDATPEAEPTPEPKPKPPVEATAGN